MNEAPRDWMWKEAPGAWWWSVLHIARAMREAKPGGPDGRDAVLEMLGFEDAILTMHQVGALLFRILVGKEDARKVFLQDKRKKPNQRPQHVRMATAYWLARAGDPSAPDGVAIEAARGIQKGKRSRPLSTKTIRKIAQRYRSEVFEDFEEGDDLYDIGIPSPEAFRHLKDHLWRKVGPKIGPLEELQKGVRFPELDPAARGRSQRSSPMAPDRPIEWGAWMLGEAVDAPGFELAAILAEWFAAGAPPAPQPSGDRARSQKRAGPARRRSIAKRPVRSEARTRSET